MGRAIIAQRVKEVREKRGLTQTELAKRLGCKSHTSIVAVEQGTKDLKMWELLKFAEVLNVSPEILYSSKSIDLSPIPHILWRQKKKELVNLRQEEQHIYQHCEDYLLLKKLISHPSLLSREIPQKDLDIQKVTFEWANRLAEELCHEMNLGDYPAEILARRLEEDFGVILLMRPLKNGSAACMRSEAFSVIVLNEKDIPWRRVFSLAHELFHIVTWGDPLLKKIQSSESLFLKNEQLADAFAAALLMPRQMIARDLGSNHLTFSMIVALARKYSVSAHAMLWRLCHLKLLTESVVNKTIEDKEFQKLDRSSYERALEATPPFGNKFLRLAYLAFESGRLSKARLAKLLEVNLRDVEKYLSKYGFEITHDKEITICNP